MYYICKFSDTWSLYDAEKGTSRNLDITEVNCIKSLLPGLLNENKILTALQVSSINPNKLLQLPIHTPVPVKRTPDLTKS